MSSINQELEDKSVENTDSPHMTDSQEPELLRALSRAERTGTGAQLANALDHLALHYHAQGAYQQAAPLYARALGTWRQILGPEHPSVGTLLLNLAALYQHLGDSGAAEPLFRNALGIFENDVGLDDSGVIESLEAFVKTIAAGGRREEAELLDERVRRIRSRVLETVQVRS